MCTKLLHRKRPLLIPIIDSFVWADWAGKELRHGWTTHAMVGVFVHRKVDHFDHRKVDHPKLVYFRGFVSRPALSRNR